MAPVAMGAMRVILIAVIVLACATGVASLAWRAAVPAGFVVVQLANAPSPSRALLLLFAAGLAVVAAALCGALARGARGSLRRLEDALDVLETLPRGEPVDVGPDRELRGVAERLNRLLERAAAAAERDEELLAIVARELRRPVRDARDTLKRMGAGEPFARGPMELDEELDVLETVLEDVLLTARLRLDRVVLRKRRTRLGVLVQDAAAKMASTNPVTFEIDPDLPEVDVDGRLLSRAVAEIVRNAAQHSDAGAAIAVRVRQLGPNLIVSVTDGGGGITPADRERLFEPFFRSPTARRHLPGGTGLGLTLAKRVLDAHGGTIAAESEPGVGTTITFTLPPATGEPPEERPSLDGPRDSRFSGG
jgi:two-component system sensor histidine kinase BaeS